MKQRTKYALVFGFLPLMLFFQNCRYTDSTADVQKSSTNNLPINSASNSLASDGEPYGGKLSYYALLSNFTCPDQSGAEIASPLGKITYANGQYVLEALNCQNTQQVLATNEIKAEIEDGIVSVIYKNRAFQQLKSPPPLSDPNFIFKEAGCIETFESIYKRKFGTSTLDPNSPDVENGALIRYDRYDFSIYSNYQGNKSAKANLKYFSPEVVANYSSAQEIPNIWSQLYLNLIFQKRSTEFNWFSDAFNLNMKFQKNLNGTTTAIGLVSFIKDDNTEMGPLSAVCPIFNEQPSF